MRRLFNEWTVNVDKIDDAYYGNGFFAEAYVAKLDGTKECVHVFRCFDKHIKTHTDMYNYVTKILDTL